MPRGRPHAPGLRAQAVAAVAAGESVHGVAKRMGIGYQTVHRWYAEDGPVHSADAHARTREALGELVYDLLLDNIETLRVQARLARSEDWFAQQSASEVAELVSVLSDRTIRLLAAFRPAEPQALPEPAIEEY